MQNGSSVGICTQRIYVSARLAQICVLSRCLRTKISASELSGKSIKSALLVGKFSLHSSSDILPNKSASFCGEAYLLKLDKKKTVRDRHAHLKGAKKDVVAPILWLPESV